MEEDPYPTRGKRGDLRVPRSVSMPPDRYYSLVEKMSEEGTFLVALHAMDRGARARDGRRSAAGVHPTHHTDARVNR